MVIDDSAVGADRNIDAGLLKIFVSGLADLDQGCRLAAADSLGLACDADGSAADSDLDKVRSAFRQEQETFLIHNIACAHLDGVAVFFADPGKGKLLPFGKSLGGVDAENIRARLNQCGNTLRVVSGIDTGADHKALLRVEHFAGVLLMGIVVLAEDESDQAAVITDNRKLVDLVVPDEVIGLTDGHAFLCGDNLLDGGHELGDLFVRTHAADTIITARDDTQQFSACGAVICNGDRGVSGLFFQIEDVLKGRVRADIGITGNKPRLKALGAGYHRGFALDCLGSVDEGYTAALCERHSQPVAGDRLHDCGDHGNSQLDRRFFTFFVFDKRSFERHVCRHAFTG